MKYLMVMMAVLLSSTVWASQVSTNLQTSGNTGFSMEPSLSMTSINGGSRLFSLALIADMTSWLSLGLEGDLPTDFEKQDQFYMARFLTRINILKNNNVVFLQGSISQGFFNGSGHTDPFAAVGFQAGYLRRFSKDWGFGGRIGAQYVTSRFEGGEVVSESGVINNRMTVVGSYFF